MHTHRPIAGTAACALLWFALPLLLLLNSLFAHGQAVGNAERGATRAKECMGCHGRPGRGPLSGMPSLAGQQQEFILLQLGLIQKKVRDAPDMADMLKEYSEQDLADIAAFFTAMKPPPQRGTRDPDRYAEGSASAIKNECAKCHMPGYTGDRQIPRIIGQREEYLAKTLTAYRDNKRRGIDDSMNAAASRLTDTDIAAIAHYLAHQE